MEIPSLSVLFVSGGTQIGKARLIAVDPSMGYASGKFEPTSFYDRTRHADTISDFTLREVSMTIEARRENGEIIPTLSIAIQDYSAELNEIEVHVRLTSAEQYEALFPGAYDAERQHYASIISKSDEASKSAISAPKNESRGNHLSRIVKKITRIFGG